MQKVTGADVAALTSATPAMKQSTALSTCANVDGGDDDDDDLEGDDTSTCIIATTERLIHILAWFNFGCVLASGALLDAWLGLESLAIESGCYPTTFQPNRLHQTSI
jgi:hypothetical protein